jgi:hypothetical protein
MRCTPVVFFFIVSQRSSRCPYTLLLIELPTPVVENNTGSAQQRLKLVRTYIRNSFINVHVAVTVCHSNKSMLSSVWITSSCVYPAILFQKNKWRHNVTKQVKNTMQQTTDQSLSLVSAVKLWNMSLQNTYLTIWKATVYYMIFNIASDILDPVKPNYCPLFKNLLQIQIKIFKLISLSWTLPKPLTNFHINDF